jgi:AraC family transcriptional regulator of adaptative response/methylated-DNA-[protein]-cysteine methyltransferase
MSEAMVPGPEDPTVWQRGEAFRRWADSGIDADRDPSGVILREVGEGFPREGWRGRAMTPWGGCGLAWSAVGILQLEFEEDPSGTRPWTGLRDGPALRKEFSIDDAGAARWIERWLDPQRSRSRPIPVAVRGTPFQRKVWRALLDVPRGRLTSYGRLASAIGHPGAARAVGAACGANPVALVIPCHRVVRESGDLNGYRWGVDRKARLLTWESEKG